jgi:hypothetical protein
MHVPAEWMRDEVVALAVFTEGIADFVNRSKRFNAVVLVWEEVIPFLKGGLPRMMMRACFNEQARHRFEPRQLFTIGAAIDGRAIMAFSFLERLKALRTKLQASS